MATRTTNYGLYKPDPTDDYVDFLSEFNDNMDEIDDHLGGGGGGDTYNIYGAFVNTNRVIASGQHLQTWTYTATEDCFVVTSVAIAQNTGANCQIDGVTTSEWYNTGSLLLENIEVYLRKGQTFAVNGTYSATSNYFVYGLTQGTDSIFTPIIYSDVERCIGIWRDNKPLYQRSWTGTKSTSSDEIIINDPPSIDTLANSFVTIKGSTGSQIAQYYRDSNDRARIWLEGGKIHMDSGASYPIMPYTYTVTLQYTKTTDVAGSGNWNTDGIPTVHYSTSEQVIGTWIDGKPIYQRVITGLSIGQNSGTVYTIPIPSPDLEQIIDSTLMATLTQYKSMTHPPTWITNPSNLAIRSQGADTYDTFIIAYTKATD